MGDATSAKVEESGNAVLEVLSDMTSTAPGSDAAMVTLLARLVRLVS